MPRIVILGCAGTGKTTVANRLGECTRAPVVCLDALWQPYRHANDVAAFRDVVKQTHIGGNWISDGNFSQATFDLRLPRATLVIWLEYSRPMCLWRAITRVVRSGEPHRVGQLAEVVRFIWNFDRINRPRIEALRTLHGRDVPVRRLAGDRAVSAFLSSIARNAVL
jgi:adenylate kinase family enzyme